MILILTERQRCILFPARSVRTLEYQHGTAPLGDRCSKPITVHAVFFSWLSAVSYYNKRNPLRYVHVNALWTILISRNIKHHPPYLFRRISLARTRDVCIWCAYEHRMLRSCTRFDTSLAHAHTVFLFQPKSARLAYVFGPRCFRYFREKGPPPQRTSFAVRLRSRPVT